MDLGKVFDERERKLGNVSPIMTKNREKVGMFAERYEPSNRRNLFSYCWRRWFFT